MLVRPPNPWPIGAHDKNHGIDRHLMTVVSERRVRDSRAKIVS